jgi:hypothetical protein
LQPAHERRARPQVQRAGASPPPPPTSAQVFGPYAAAAIAERLLGCIRDCLDSLDKLLEKHQPELDLVMDQYESKGSCMEAGAALAIGWSAHSSRCCIWFQLHAPDCRWVCGWELTHAR